MGVLTLMRGSVLILVNERGDRRKLFELLDGQDFEAIFAAKDVTQARSMLASEDALDMIVLEFGSADFEVRALADEIADNPAFSKVPVIGVIPGSLDAVFGVAPPKHVTAWISSPVDPQGALTVIERALMPPEAPSEAALENLPQALSGGLGSYRFAFDASLDEMILSDPVTGKVIDANQTFVTQSGMSLSDVQGRPLDDLDLTHKGPARRELLQQAMRQGNVRYRGQVPRGDGTRLTMDAHIRLVRADGEVRLLSCFRAQAADPNRRVFGDFVDGLWAARGSDNLARNLTQKLVDYAKLDFLLLIAKRAELGEGNDLVVSQIRPGFSAGLIEQLKGPVLRKVLDGEAFLANTNAWKALGAAGQEAQGRIEMLFGVPIRDERQVVIGGLIGAGRESFGEEAGVANWVRALSARVALELEIERAQELGRAKGLQDSLTSLPNRLLFNDRLETTIKEAHRTGEMFAVLFVDLDRFKNVNDSLGHSVGDELLIAVGKRLRSCLRGSDTVARYAGDEFTLILRHIVQREDVLRIAEKICRVLEAPLTLSDGRELHITASIGISFYPDDADSAEKLLMHADIAMYNAKGMGRNNFQTYVAVPEESHQQRLALETKLRVAERNGELRAYYQPQVSSVTEDIIGMEALIRWEHPELGMISPGFFIPLAEDTGLIMSIGEWMLRTALTDTKRWHDRFGLPLRISVNLSALQLKQPNLKEVVERALQDTGLEAKHVELEVTESINVKNIPNLIDTLQSLRDMGCSIAIDDFGTGQSSLDYIRRFPADRIKIDQVFVRNIGVDPDDEAIVRATINMSQQLNRGVIAEGVEYEEHLRFLREHGCEELQGYLFCRPLPAASFENLLAEREKLVGPPRTIETLSDD